MFAAQAEQLRAAGARPLRTLAELLAVWLSAEHDWKPSTWHNYRLAAARLAKDPLASRSPTQLSPPVVTAAVRAWRAAGVPPSTMALHVRTLRAALGWAYAQRLIACQPMDGLRGLPQSEPPGDVPVAVVAELLRAADDDLAHAASDLSRHAAEQLRLLLQLAADTGPRRGELAALRIDDLDGRRLRIERGLSDEVLTTTKTGRARTITTGSWTAALWHSTVQSWRGRLDDETLGPWLFATTGSHQTRLGAGRAAELFRAFCRRHDAGEVTLHRLRHTVTTVLVADGQLLQAQQRLGHRDDSTTLRQYCHALPLEDADVANHLENRYREG